MTNTKTIILTESQLNHLLETTTEEINAACKDINTNPTEKQKEAGNYKMGHFSIKGMSITIENPKGSYRYYKNANGSEGKIKMKNHYGYFTNTSGNGKDGDAVDVFIGNHPEDFELVFVVDQNNKEGDFDESKVMLGFKSKEEAKKAYLSNYSKGWKGFRDITAVSLELFKKWLYRGKKQRKPFAEYVKYKRKSVVNETLDNPFGEKDKTFKPDSSWMAQKYDEMNAMLFNGKLGACDFGIFTTGRGSGGGVLGWFEMRGANIKASRYDRRMYALTFAGKEYVTKDNFVEVCKPKIELNGNYRGTEHGFLCTLVHEMCHYYTYMNGWAPTQAHGREFRDIGMVVASRSNGLFTVQRLASAEQMSELELSDEMKAKKEKRLASKKASMSAVVVFMPNGNVELTTTSSQALIDKIKLYRGSGDKTGTIFDKLYGANVVVSSNPQVIDFLFSKGYRTNMRTWQYWDIGGKPWIEEFKRMLGVKNDVQSGDSESNTPRKLFSIKTTNGVFECGADGKDELVSKIRQRFPKMSDETIEKVINNPANYKTVTNEGIERVVEEVLDEYFNSENVDSDDSVSIKPGVNLGLASPFQI